MGFFGRILWTMTGKSKRRIPRQMELLGAPKNAVEISRGMNEEKQEEQLAEFVGGRHACLLDWRAGRDEIHDGLKNVLSKKDVAFLPALESLPPAQGAAVAMIIESLSNSPITLVHTESFGDFSFIFVVQKNIEKEFVKAVGPWLIKDKIS